MSDNLTRACRLTCIGGSAQGTCECRRPVDCVMREHPGFADASARAVERFVVRCADGDSGLEAAIREAMKS